MKQKTKKNGQTSKNNDTQVQAEMLCGVPFAWNTTEG